MTTTTNTTVLALVAAVLLAVAPTPADHHDAELAPTADHRTEPTPVEHDHHAEIEMMDEAIDRLDRMIVHTDDILDALDEMGAILDRLSPQGDPDGRQHEDLRPTSQPADTQPTD